MLAGGQKLPRPSHPPGLESDKCIMACQGPVLIGGAQAWHVSPSRRIDETRRRRMPKRRCDKNWGALRGGGFPFKSTDMKRIMMPL